MATFPETARRTNQRQIPQPHANPDRGAIDLTEDGVVITTLVVDDPHVAAHLAALAPEQRGDEIRAALSIGVRGLAAMGSSATAHRVGEVVDRFVTDACNRSESRVSALLDEARRQMARTLDPDVRSSLPARLVADLAKIHGQLIDAIDPDRRDSRTARFVAELSALLGPSGELERRLTEALDPTAETSAMAAVMRSIDERFKELRDVIVASGARTAEAVRGTAKGFDFEDVVEARLRSEAGHLGGAVVDRTSAVPGASGGALVGDATVTLPDGVRVVVEAKRAARITLSGADGILAELDRAMANRDATWAICVSHDDAFPQEVGAFGIYGNRILVVDDGTGDLIRVALRWVGAAARLAAEAPDAATVDDLRNRLDRLRGLATRFSRAKRGLGAVQSSVESVRVELDALRTDLLDSVDDLAGSLRGTARGEPTWVPDEPSPVACDTGRHEEVRSGLGMGLHVP